MSDVEKTAEDVKIEKLIAEVDEITRARIACLAARGLTDFTIAELVILSYEHVTAVKTTEEYKKKYAEEADRIIQEQFDRDEGWDEVENQALAGLLGVMKYNKDPKFLLATAKIANSAERRAREKQVAPKVVDATEKAGVTNNIIILSMNREYVERQQNKMIDVTPRPAQIPLKQSDVPAPKLVEQILAPAKEKAGLVATDPMKDEMQRMFELSGVVFDKDE